MAKRLPAKKLGSAAQRRGNDGQQARPVGGVRKPRYLQTRINDEGWQELKLLSIGERRPVQALVVEALNDMLRKYRRNPVVAGPSD